MNESAIWSSARFSELAEVLKVFHPVDTFIMELQENNQKPTPIIEKHPIDGILSTTQIQALVDMYGDYTIHFFSVKRKPTGDSIIKVIVILED